MDTRILISQDVNLAMRQVSAQLRQWQPCRVTSSSLSQELKTLLLLFQALARLATATT